MAFVNSSGARIHWQAEGVGAPVLLIMGHLYSSRMWYPLMPALAARHRVIRFDNRGTGQSETTRSATIGDFAADALAVLDAAGVERAHVYGVSMGGGIALEFALRYPHRVSSLVLGCTMMKTTDTTRRRGIAARMLYWLPRSLIMAMPRSRAAYGSAAPAEAVDKDLEVLDGERYTMRGVRVQARAIEAYATKREAVAQLAMPTLVLHGDEDGAVDVKYGRELAEVIPGSRLAIFEGAGHNFLVAAGPQSTRAVLDFFDEVDRRVAGGAGHDSTGSG